MYPRIQLVQAAPPPATDNIYRRLESQVSVPAQRLYMAGSGHST